MRNPLKHPTPLAIDEFEAAILLGMSVHFLRKDRTGARLIPFYRIGGAIRYSPEVLKNALAALQQGGNLS